MSTLREVLEARANSGYGVITHTELRTVLDEHPEPDTVRLLAAIDAADNALQRRAEQLWHAFDAEPDAENRAYAASTDFCLGLFRGAIHDALDKP